MSLAIGLILWFLSGFCFMMRNIKTTLEKYHRMTVGDAIVSCIILLTGPMNILVDAFLWMADGGLGRIIDKVIYKQKDW